MCSCSFFFMSFVIPHKCHFGSAPSRSRHFQSLGHVCQAALKPFPPPQIAHTSRCLLPWPWQSEQMSSETGTLCECWSWGQEFRQGLCVIAVNQAKDQTQQTTCKHQVPRTRGEIDVSVAIPRVLRQTNKESKG